MWVLLSTPHNRAALTPTAALRHELTGIRSGRAAWHRSQRGARQTGQQRPRGKALAVFEIFEVFVPKEGGLKEKRVRRLAEGRAERLSR